jgi:translocation and assembly module TamB
MEPAGPPVTLALNVKANDKVFIRGRGLESEWSADIAVSGDAEDPLFEGKLELRRGYLDFAGRRFALSRGLIAFDRYAPNNPRLDIRAEHETKDGVTAIIEIKGRAQSPDISLLSTPSLPSEDVMALVLFGKPATDLSALESLQVAQALAQITGVGPFGGAGITGTARRALGLDMLSLAFDAETGAGALEVGKYVADGLFVSATQDARGENGSVRIEYEIAKSVTVETELKQDGDQTVSANWKIDF